MRNLSAYSIPLAPDTVARAEVAAFEAGETVETALVRLGLVSEPALADAFAREFSLPLATAADLAAVPAPLLPTISPAFLRARRVLPLAIEPGEAPDTPGPIALAMADPRDDYAAEAIALHAGRPVRRRVATPTDLDAALDRLHPISPTAEGPTGTGAEDLERLRDLASGAPSSGHGPLGWAA